MIDCGASTQFIDLEFANKLGLTLNKKKKPELLNLADGSESVGKITHTCTIDLKIDQHLETLTFQVTKLGWNMILGKT